jgi:undecaprenyl-diphosphatase
MDEILQFMQSIDRSLFFAFNVSIANSFFDTLMVWITDKHHWYLPGGILWLYIMWRGGREGRALGIMVILGIVLADQISSSILKPLTERARPCKTLEGFRLLVHCGSLYGFPSSHASNIAVIGGLFIHFYRKWFPFWVLLIFLIGFSRVYVGVHYPFDVIAGWFLGILIAVLLIYLYNKFVKPAKWFKAKETPDLSF